jgi:cobalt-zinc-cadmium efflux system membrane fusion protein
MTVRRPLSVFGLVAFAAAFATACSRAPASDAAASTPAAAGLAPGEVQLEPPEMQSISVDTVRSRSRRVVATLPAQLFLDEDHTVRVLSPVSGRIVSLDARPGDLVTAGQALVHITSSDLAQAASDQQKAEASTRQSAAALIRAESLYAHQVIALKDLQTAEADAASDRAEATRAAQRVAQLGQAGRDGTGDFVLRAPIAGEIVDRQANPGMEVSADANGPLFTISHLETLWVTASAYQQNLSQVHRGQHLTFTTSAMPDKRYDAVVTYVGGTLDSTTRTAVVRATLANPGRELRAQIFGEVRLYAPDSSGVPAVPVTALVTAGDETIVFVQTAPNRFMRRAVVVADDDGDMASISDGIRPGERVVTRGSILLQGRLTQGS